MRKTTGVLISLLALSVLFSCGETTGTRGLRDFRTIHIYKIFNETDQPDLAVMLKDVLYDQFNIDGRLIPIDDPDKADLLLGVQIDQYIKAVSTYTPQQLPDQMLLGMTVKMMIQNVRTQQALNNQTIEEKTFFNLLTPPVSTEQDMKKQLVDSLAKKILLVAVEGFY